MGACGLVPTRQTQEPVRRQPEPLPRYLRSGDAQGGVQARLREQKAGGLLHLGGPDARVQGRFGEGDVCWVGSFSLRNGL